MRDSRTLSSFTESCRDQGMIPGGRTLEKSTVVLNPKIARRLEQAPGSQGIYMSRLRFADREPVIIERNYFPMKYAARIKRLRCAAQQIQRRSCSRSR